MQWRKDNNSYLLKLERGEPVIETVTDFCKEQGIHGGFLWGLGAIEDTTLGYYTLTDKQYHFTEYPEAREVASMTGNVALVEGEPYLHVHAVLSEANEEAPNTAIAGHLKEAFVAVTLEVCIMPTAQPVERAHDAAIGLNLFSL